MTFAPRKSPTVVRGFKIPQSEETTGLLEETGLSTLQYDAHNGYYRIQVKSNDLDEHKGTLTEFITKARDAFFR